MPSRNEHLISSALCGAVLGIMLSHERTLSDLLKAAGCGALGGAVGGMMPDILDPPTSPFHRDFGHGIVPQCATPVIAMSAAHPILRGIAIGYCMHLWMDAQTPMGLPL